MKYNMFIYILYAYVLLLLFLRMSLMHLLNKTEVGYRVPLDFYKMTKGAVRQKWLGTSDISIM